MITTATAPLRSLRRSTSLMGTSLRSANRATGTRSSWPFSITSTAISRPELELHLIADNYATHKHPRVKAWLARHRRFHLHYTPTYASWLNQVERWFALISQQAIRRDSFRNESDLIKKMDR